MFMEMMFDIAVDNSFISVILLCIYFVIVLQIEICLHLSVWCCYCLHDFSI